MTATLPRAATAPGPSRPTLDLARDDVRRTLVVALGSLLGFVPLRTVFSDQTWLIETVGALFCVFVPAAALRLREAPRPTQLLPGLAVLIVYACTLYLHVRSFGGFLPSPAAWDEIGRLRHQASVQVANNVAPMHSTRALRVQVVPALGLVAAVIDYLAVVRRSPALAGIPLLALFTVCGASAGKTVGALAVVCAGAGFLLILSADARINLARWGRIIPRRADEPTAAPRLGLSGRRIGVIAVLIALLLPAVVPGLGRNVLASTFHRGSAASTNGGTGTGLSPFASLRGNLTSTATIDLLKVHVSGTSDPFYLRSKVLDTDTLTGWTSSGDSSTQHPLSSAAFSAYTPAVKINATMTVEHLNDTALPTFGVIQGTGGLSDSWKFDTARSTVSGHRTNSGLTYTEQAAQPSSTAAQLASEPPADTRAVPARWSALPANIPALVSTTVQAVVGDRTGAYDIARAINNYFTDPANGFAYSLSTKAGDSNDDLVNFLNNRTGFCQQYAAAMAVMLRVAGVPARVVLGYTHSALDAHGDVTVTNHDAHAWVEAYLPRAGWLPFDPTPIDVQRKSALPYVPTAAAANIRDGDEPRNTRPTPTPTAHSDAPKPSAAPVGAARPAPVHGHLRVPAPLIEALVVLLLVALSLSLLPAARGYVRRRRLRRARRERSAEPLWEELRAMARDGGLLWAASTTPRQVPAWLAGLGVRDVAAVSTLAAQVEQERYASVPAALTDVQLENFTTGLHLATAELTQRQTGWTRWRNRLAPRSLTSGLSGRVHQFVRQVRRR